jgi:uncharacterized damage-inducible protein DinB
MSVSASTILEHLDYSSWASRRLVDAVSQLSPEDLTRDFATADRSILGTLVHIYAADRAWIGRIEGAPPDTFVDPAIDMHLSVLQNDWPVVQQRWHTMAANLDDNAVQTVVSYTDTKGNPYKNTIQQIVLHVVNHATHHRGQVSGFLRTMGHRPPVLDLMKYYREHPSA